MYDVKQVYIISRAIINYLDIHVHVVYTVFYM